MAQHMRFLSFYVYKGYNFLFLETKIYLTFVVLSMALAWELSHLRTNKFKRLDNIGLDINFFHTYWTHHE